MSSLLRRLARTHHLSHNEWRTLLGELPTETFTQAQGLAQELAQAHFGRDIFVRGIIECTNVCRNNCHYCGLRAENTTLPRYRLPKDEILDVGQHGARAGIKTLVLQGGEDPALTDEWLTDLIQRLKSTLPDCAITLSFGERSAASYAALARAGADRYLLRHETASPALYRKLHPESQRFWQRIFCLTTLKSLGFQTGCGMMVGVPHQTLDDLAEDMAFIQDFRPAMLGIGPFLPHHATPFAAEAAGDGKMTLYLLSLCRILLPQVLLPATTALRHYIPEGLRQGVLHGANVVMPSLTPSREKANYTLYDTAHVQESLAQTIENFRQELAPIGYALCEGRGDAR